ncbi:MAG TPA: hypothetical protein VL974_01975 [Magnetospirillum sp.]|jgi:hypothetical protein|nr:hypothetical protein [Magnetospirillum sp.]
MKAWMALAGTLALAACGDGDIKEVSRTPSPVGELDAVIGSMKAGESQPFLVTIVKTGENPGKGPRLLLTDQTSAPKVEWLDPDHVTIHCDGTARVWSYRNFWTNGSATIAVGLDCGTLGWRP